LLTETYSRQEVSVTFLAVLEMVKQHRVRARQERMFGEIFISQGKE
jgi:chromatin segregation and condensation protein Rec8/ScpA/Scc1 (kleisin family)